MFLCILISADKVYVVEKIDFTTFNTSVVTADMPNKSLHNYSYFSVYSINFTEQGYEAEKNNYWGFIRL